MIRPGASEGLSNAHYAAMGNYILMPQTGIPHAGISQTQATGGANTAQAHLQAVQNSQVPVTSHQMNPQSAGASAAGYRQQFQYPLHSVGQQLIVPQMQQFQMQQFPLLQSKFFSSCSFKLHLLHACCIIVMHRLNSSLHNILFSAAMMPTQMVNMFLKQNFIT